MTRSNQFVLACALALVAAGCATPPAAPPREAAAAQSAATPSQRLARLLDDSDEASLRRNPIEALYRGDMRYAGRYGDYLSDAWIAAERASAADDLRRLAAIDRARLGAVDRATYDTFAWQRTTDAREYEAALVAVWLPLTLEHFDGAHLFFPELSSGNGIAPYSSVADYDNGLARIDEFIVWLDTAAARCREGLERGVVHPRFVIERLIEQFDSFARQRIDDSPYGGPIRKLPASLPAADRERLTRAYARAIDERLAPAFARVRELLKREVLPRARASVGLAALPGGAAYYRFLIEQQTTTRLEPAAIHQLGSSEVARITAGMNEIRRRVGFDGTLAHWFEHIRSDARLEPASSEALRDGYRAIGERVQAALPRLFAVAPRGPLDIRPTPPHQEQTDAAARYQSGTPDGSRPGIFYFNSWNLPSRTTERMETLYLHEAVPGHHFQVSLARENEALPKLLRFGGNTAYVEGWALYAESLGPELGLFTDPYQLFGHYDGEMLRGLRLVVDTGLHALGWTREQAIDYMLAHSAMSRSDATAEVERYIVMPAQALAYKVGQLTIRRLRSKAEAALGARFDIREFHQQVLGTGALPLAVLEAKIDDWIAQRRSQ